MQIITMLLSAILPIGCPAAVDYAVLDVVKSRVQSYNYLDVWLSGDYNPAHWEPKFKKEEAMIVRIRTWAGGLKDPCLKESYFGWLSYYQHEIDSARKELRTKETKRSHEDYDKSLKDVFREADRLRPTIPVPPK